jgi:hypothetical protein
MYNQLSMNSQKAAPAAGYSGSTTTPELGGPEAAALKQQVAQGNLRPFREMLSQSRQQRDWQDRYFMTDLVVPNCLRSALDAACASEPNAADVFLLRGAHLTYLAWKGRGSHVAEKTPQANFESAASNVQAALPDLKKAMSLDPDDPVPYVFAMNALRIFSAGDEQLAKAYARAAYLAPDFLQAHWFMITAQSKKWGGSHEKSLQIARSAAAKAKPGSDLFAVLFNAHILIWQFASAFDKDFKRANAYPSRPDVMVEMREAFDRWISGSYRPRRSSIPYLHHAAFWFFKARDRNRLKQALALTGNTFSEQPWNFVRKADATYSQAREAAAGGAFPPQFKPSLTTRFLLGLVRFLKS